MIRDANLSDEQMLKVLRTFKHKFGNKSISSNIRETLKNRKTILDLFFKKEKIEFEKKNGDIHETYLVYCSDVPGLMKHVLEYRSLSETSINHLGNKLFIYI